MTEIRVRFAPSPTGPLHIGGVRTALYNYLFARQKGGTFILRIEDTDQTRFVEGAEDYIQSALAWLNMQPDEGPHCGGDYGPYKQSLRKDLYQAEIEKLIKNGTAYYAFDTPEQIADMRNRREAEGVHSPKYDHSVRLEMSNSLTHDEDFTREWLASGKPYVVRLKVNPGSKVSFVDKIRGEVEFSSDELDDKVLMKGDGLPTYHFANVVDDHHMKISHVIRGEEWLSSTPHHVLLYQAFGWDDSMPLFVHLPLILKPTGKGKLSKRDGAKFGFPVFPAEWVEGDEHYLGFREMGFLPNAVVNFLVLLGWHPTSDEEVFSMENLIEVFDIDQISKSGARFDFEKAKWFNQQYIMMTSDEELLTKLRETHDELPAPDEVMIEVIREMKPRLTTIDELLSLGYYFFETPRDFDEKMIKKKWKPEIIPFYNDLIHCLRDLDAWNKEELETTVKSFIAQKELSFGDIFPLLRLALSGTMKGPDLFNFMTILKKSEVINRLESAIEIFNKWSHGRE